MSTEFQCFAGDHDRFAESSLTMRAPGRGQYAASCAVLNEFPTIAGKRRRFQSLGRMRSRETGRGLGGSTMKSRWSRISRRSSAPASKKFLELVGVAAVWLG